MVNMTNTRDIYKISGIKTSSKYIGEHRNSQLICMV
jgi:hypothetical protein